MWEYVIVGGGASGLAAAVFCARFTAGERVLVLEKAPRVGKKLLSTGNGTCNISNITAAPSFYHGEQGTFTAAALAAFSPKAAMAFFDSIGVSCVVRDNGRVYPRCEQAGAVLDCLRLTLDELGVTVRCDSPVTALAKTANGFSLTTPTETIVAKRVLLATGGAAAPSLGGSADSYGLAVSLGHRKTPLFPSIVQVRTDTTFIRAMKGLRTDATVTVYQDGAPRATCTGEVLFTEYGLSGPAVMQVSRLAGDWERRKKGTLTMTLDLLPDLSADEVMAHLRGREARGRKGEDFLTGLLNKRIGQTVCRKAGVSLTESVQPTHLAALCDAIKAFSVAVTGTQGFGGAQVTAGGIHTADIDPHTMESTLVRGLYLLGELQDIDGDCGGYNLQWAWSSAYAAAVAATGGTR